MNINEFMKKVGVSKKRYVEDWVRLGLIPGVTKDENTGELDFPASARRPYRAHCKPDASASTIRASIINACLKKQYISNATYCMSEGEFAAIINDLENAGLICTRIEDEIVYYDSTSKCDEYKGKTIKELQKFVVECIGTVAEKVSYGATKAFLDKTALAS